MYLVLGRSGQVATELIDLMPQALVLSRPEADLDRPQDAARRVEGALDTSDVHAVINAAAYTAVDQAEQDEDRARRINAEAPGEIAQVCAARDVPFVHLSTDYVFDGKGQAPFAPDAPTGPLGAYGRTKRAGEVAVRAASGPHAILRTSWVFSAQGANFVRTMLRLSAERQALRIVDDQIGGPTPARAIAAACLSIAETLAKDPGKSGAYHFAGTPDTSWAGFARAIFEAAGRQVAVSGIATSEYPTPARRPLNSRLDCTSTRKVFGLDRPDWRDGLEDVLAALQEAK